jgi:hypothetical protein
VAVTTTRATTIQTEPAISTTSPIEEGKETGGKTDKEKDNRGIVIGIVIAVIVIAGGVSALLLVRKKK